MCISVSALCTDPLQQLSSSLRLALPRLAPHTPQHQPHPRCCQHTHTTLISTRSGTCPSPTHARASHSRSRTLCFSASLSAALHHSSSRCCSALARAGEESRIACMHCLFLSRDSLPKERLTLVLLSSLSLGSPPPPVVPPPCLPAAERPLASSGSRPFPNCGSGIFRFTLPRNYDNSLFHPFNHAFAIAIRT